MTTNSEIFRRLYWIFSTQFGLNPLTLVRGLARVPEYLAERRRFRRSQKEHGLATPMIFMPALHDRNAKAGHLHEYFWQDLFVAKLILDAHPQRHLDIGSRIDGFVAHLAASREVEVIDIRPVDHGIPNVRFLQADMMSRLPAELIACTDSVSCLHTIEHFGLGRYGDRIDASGMATGIENIAAMLRDGGTLYLSTPIGRQRVEFNAHRVSDPRTIVRLAEASGLRLQHFFALENHLIAEQHDVESACIRLAAAHYALGIFVFTRHTLLGAG